ncbi:MAG: DUF3990 domain-containing protein [Clostridia bacterium]|nr:DUF3990 domain-containing protein [Clostridia bacterium]
MLLYYGADRLVAKPEFNFGNPSNDYGLGLYLTPDKETARLWASKNKEGGFCISYEVDMSKLRAFDMREVNEENVLKWLSILVQHRFSRDEYETYRKNVEWLKEQYQIDERNQDVIIGYRADDSYFTYSRDFVANSLSLETLAEAMKLGKLGEQYVLKSRKAFNCISMVEYETIEYSEEYKIFRERTSEEYRKLKRDDDINNTFIRDLMRKG